MSFDYNVSPMGSPRQPNRNYLGIVNQQQNNVAFNLYAQQHLDTILNLNLNLVLGDTQLNSRVASWIQQFKNQLNQSNSTNNQQNQQISNLNNRVSNLSNHVSDFDAWIDELRAELSQHSEQISENTEQIENQNNQIAEQNQKIADLKAQTEANAANAAAQAAQQAKQGRIDLVTTIAEGITDETGAFDATYFANHNNGAVFSDYYKPQGGIFQGRAPNAAVEGLMDQLDDKVDWKAFRDHYAALGTFANDPSGYGRDANSAMLWFITKGHDIDLTPFVL